MIEWLADLVIGTRMNMEQTVLASVIIICITWYLTS